jgi:hypothetical protein
VSVLGAVDIRERPGHHAVDAEGLRIGGLEAVYVDTTTDLPSLSTVIVGLPTRHQLAFVTLGQAMVGPGTSRPAIAEKRVKDAPWIGTDGELPAGGEEQSSRYYGLPYQMGADGERRLGRH